ncbi:MAG: hypothetical protein K1Y36_16650 [Blastocatellia bacterium]|nr:hypothetical protein [Blastocatellia bacterium]
MKPLPNPLQENHRHMMVRYLLGQTSEVEREAVEARFFEDDDFFGELKAVEDELIDAFLANQLPAEQREQFEREYLRLPERRQKVELHRALHRRSSEDRSAKTDLISPPDPAPTPVGPASVVSLEHHRDTRRLVTPVRRMAWAAAVAAILLGGGWVFSVIQSFRNEIESLKSGRAELEQKNRASQTQLAQEQKRSEALAQEAAAEHDRANRLEAQLTQGQNGLSPSIGKPAVVPEVLSCLLFPTLTRGGGIKPLHVTPTAQTLQVKLVLQPAPSDQTLDATLRTVEGEEVWHQKGLPVRQEKGSSMLSFSLHVTTVPAGDYVIELARKLQDNSSETVLTYSLSLRRP